MTKELLPCPFCGSPAKEQYDKDQDEWWILCGHGSCAVEPMIAGKDLPYIRTIWNSRQPAERMVMVPREPTDEMIDAAIQAMSGYPREDTIRHIYKAMLAAAPRGTENK